MKNKLITTYYPHDEMTTFLLPVTIGCSWNKCLFCNMYKDLDHETVPFDEIEMILINGDPYTEKVFLTGADPMSVGFERLIKLLAMIKKYFTYCACIACYASIQNISLYSDIELNILHENGLRMLYIGFETGRDDILKLMVKGHSVDDAIREAKRLNTANPQFNTVVMYGIAGKDEGVDNAIATANMINQFNTNRVITMNLTIFEGTGIDKLAMTGKFIPATIQERLEELKILLIKLEPTLPTIFDTTHPTNLIKMKGVIPDERNHLLSKMA